MENQEVRWLLEEKYCGEKTEGFFSDCKRLEAGEPLAFIIGSIPFLDCTIHLDSKPLIPRTETEFWVEKVIHEIREQQEVPDRDWNLHILDLCAGSGCIGVAIAKHIQNAEVDFAEIDPIHIQTIKKNLHENLQAKNEATGKSFDRSKGFRVFESDLFSTLPNDVKYDYILSNPPYIDPALDRTDESVALHEPHIALYGGAQGMECISNILTQAKKYLAPQGRLYLEHEPEQEMAIQELALSDGFVCETHTDQYNIARYSQLSMAQ